MERSTEDTARIKLMLRLGEYYMYKPGRNRGDLDSARYFQLGAERLAGHIADPKWKVLCSEAIASRLINNGNFSAGKQLYLAMAGKFKSQNDIEGEARVWLEFGKSIPVEYTDLLTDKIKAYENAAKLFGQSGNRIQEIGARKEIADVHLNEGQLVIAEKELLTVLSDYRAIHFPKLHHTYFLLSAVSRLRSDLKKELYYDLAVRKTMIATADTIDAAFFLCKLGDCYDDLGMLDHSLNAYSEGLYKYHSASDIKYSIVKRMVKVMIAQQRPSAALKFLNEYRKKNVPANAFEASAMFGAMGDCFWAMNELPKAENAYRKMIELGDHNFRSRFLPVESYVKYYQIICDFYIKTGNYRKAANYLAILEKTPKTLFSSIMMAQLRLLRFKTDSASGRYLNAIQNFQAYKKINDSVFNASRITEVSEMQFRYDMEAKDRNLQVQAKNLQLQKKDIELLTKQNQLEHYMVERSGMRVKLIGVLMLVLVLLLSVVYNRYRLKIRGNKELELKQAQISTKNVELEHLLNENQWLLKEVHHRVKNNLQIVISLLNSQSAYLRDETALNAVIESKMRVQAMSLIHQKLYTCDNASTIFMPEYINDLTGYLKDSFKSARHIFVDLEIASISLDVAQAVPLGLILNEAITNAFKYAFPLGKGELSIRLSQQTPLNFKLTINDNGPGIPAGMDLNKVKSFGLKLMRGLTEDLGGTIDIDGRSGMNISIGFSILPLLQRKPARNGSPVNV
ncbi:tetratricopeptide repeat-containing sensor histidine kinase [Mucilaginibacter sp. 22184]|uniref:tetratricopeptide repeat-containing sensor histidine kinase n=1 Tax=Mucilaginibacter sp. 22184 TaxID=3453887 RepID=UPI003F879FFB